MKIIVITGASSGFGALTARALSKAGHAVYAGMRETTGRNVPQVEEAKKFTKNNKVDLRPMELDALHRKLLSTLRFRRLSVKTKDWMSWSTMPAIWSLGRQRPSRRNNWQSCTTSMCSARSV